MLVSPDAGITPPHMRQAAQRYVSMDNAERLRRFWRMVDERFKPADEAIAIFKAVYLRDGADAAVEVAKLVIGAAAVLIAHEHGPDEARRILSAAIGAAQGQVS